jgi:hypothetical protein
MTLDDATSLCLQQSDDGGGAPDTGQGDDGEGAPDTETKDDLKDTDQCASGQRIFNGVCRVECTGAVDCPTGSYCTNLDDGTSLCLPYTNCSFLDSDTQCVGTGMYTVYGRGGMTQQYYTSYPRDADPDDVTDFEDGFFVVDEEAMGRAIGLYAASYLSEDGCQGNAGWTTILATGEPACGQAHEVMRCRRYNNECVLVPGTTLDRVSP